MTTNSSYEAPAIERTLLPDELAREGHYAGVINSDLPA